MNVANKELCQELYELSGWQTEKFIVVINAGMPSEYLSMSDDDEDFDDMDNYVASYPAYDLGYLLRKLPPATKAYNWFQIGRDAGCYTASVWYDGDYNDDYECNADTPEDAACKLAIELFKQGVLTKPPKPVEKEDE